MTTHNKEAAEREPIDANALEHIAKAHPDRCFLKGSGVLKLIGAIRNLEAEIRALTASEAAAQDHIEQPLGMVAQEAQEPGERERFYAWHGGRYGGLQAEIAWAAWQAALAAPAQAGMTDSEERGKK
jgi:hypothetical protein